MQIKALDLSFSSLDAAWVARRVAEGVDVIFQCCWTGGYANNDQLRQVAEPNLRAIREGGAMPAPYTNAAPWRTPQVWYEETLRNAGAEMQHARLVLVDIEIADGDLYIVPELALEFIEKWEADGFPTWTYSADWFVGLWKLLLGDANRVNMGRPYLHARYDGIPDLAVNPPRHPLGPLAGKQYRGSHDIEGVTVDASVTDSSFFTEEDVLTQEEHDQLAWVAAIAASLHNRILDEDAFGQVKQAILAAHSPPDLAQVTKAELLAELDRRMNG